MARPHRAFESLGYLVRACRKEMPALDALQADLGGKGFEVVAVNIDTRDAEKPLKFLKDAGVTHLAYYSDQSAKVFQDLKSAGKAFGMPTTLIIDRSGCEIGEMAGPAEWASADGVKLVSAASVARIEASAYQRTSRTDVEVCPEAGATLASGSKFCCAALVNCCDRRSHCHGVRLGQKCCRGELKLPDLRREERGNEACRIHSAP